ncbi:MAG: RNase adapter RapZ [Pigmentiphaga sp.]|nr:RNase adapter RapZ [Pigmentiphaga sp.]
MLKAVLITGISGSGKSVALRTLEDAGYLCVDNLPVRYLRDFIESAHTDGLPRVAVAIDARSPGDLADLPFTLRSLEDHDGVDLRVVFLEAATATLVHRYSESRRRHPLTDRLRDAEGHPPSLYECIAAERELLSPLRERNPVIDTSGLAPQQLRAWVRELAAVEPVPLVIAFMSFAYKAGAPLSADLVFDARCLPNPHYEPELHPLTGRDAAVAAWLADQPLVGQMLDDITRYLETWLPQYARDTRAYLNVAIGCTGGQHRSVYLVEQLSRRFATHGAVLVRHHAQVHLNPLDI